MRFSKVRLDYRGGVSLGLTDFIAVFCWFLRRVHPNRSVSYGFTWKDTVRSVHWSIIIPIEITVLWRISFSVHVTFDCSKFVIQSCGWRQCAEFATDYIFLLLFVEASPVGVSYQVFFDEINYSKDTRVDASRDGPYSHNSNFFDIANFVRIAHPNRQSQWILNGLQPLKSYLSNIFKHFVFLPRKGWQSPGTFIALRFQGLEPPEKKMGALLQDSQKLS